MKLAALASGLIAFLPAVAFAGPVAVQGEVGVVSDYRFRGVSLSAGRPALQGGLTATLEGGVHGAAWGSTLDEYGTDAAGEGATVETDWVVGWSGSLGGVDIDASAQAYVYPGGHGVDYVEAPITLSRSRGPWVATLGLAYAPKQNALGGQDNRYGSVELAWTPGPGPTTLALAGGYEDGAFAPGGKWDWSVAVRHRIGRLTTAATYVDSDLDAGALVVAVTAAF